MNSRVFVKLRINSDMHAAEEITSLVGMAADRSWASGDPKKNGKGKHRSNGWEVHSDLPPEDDLEAHLDNLLSKLEGCSDNISRLPEGMGVMLSCAVYSDYNPELYFTSEQVVRIAALRAEFDIDVYAIDD